MAWGFVIMAIDDELQEEEEFENARNVRLNMSILRRQLRDTVNPFDSTEDEFRANFRLSLEAAHYFVDTCSAFMHEGSRSTHIPNTIAILCALQFFAKGCYQKAVGNSVLSQASVSRCIKRVNNVVNRHLMHLIRFPKNDAERNVLKEGFRQKQMPNVIGIVDGTHVAIVKPTVHEEAYVNRKFYHSINVQIICDSNLRILSTNCRYPGRCLDSYVWKNSTIGATMRANYMEGNRDTYIMGDSGYTPSPWLLVPYRNAVPGMVQERFNDRFVIVRSSVERCIGHLKGRFRCLLKDRTLHYSPVTASKIITTCAVLHNIALRYNGFDEAILALDDIDNVNLGAAIPQGNEFPQEARLVRDEYANLHFQ